MIKINAGILCKKGFFCLLFLFFISLFPISILNGEENESLSVNLVAEPAFPYLSFERPVDLQCARDGSDRIFVLEQEVRNH